MFHGVVDATPVTGRDQCGWLFAGNALLIPAYCREAACVGRNKPAGRVERLAGVSGGTGTAYDPGRVVACPQVAAWRHNRTSTDPLRTTVAVRRKRAAYFGLGTGLRPNLTGFENRSGFAQPPPAPSIREPRGSESA